MSSSGQITSYQVRRKYNVKREFMKIEAADSRSGEKGDVVKDGKMTQQDE